MLPRFRHLLMSDPLMMQGGGDGKGRELLFRVLPRSGDSCIIIGTRCGRGRL